MRAGLSIVNIFHIDRPTQKTDGIKLKIIWSILPDIRMKKLFFLHKCRSTTSEFTNKKKINKYPNRSDIGALEFTTLVKHSLPLDEVVNVVVGVAFEAEATLAA